MGGILIRATTIPSEFINELHPLLKADGSYIPSEYEKLLIDRIRQMSYPLLVCFVWTILVIIIFNGVGNQVDFCVSIIPVLVQFISTFIYPTSPRALSYRWVSGLRLTIEFFFVIIVARYISFLSTTSLSCTLTNSAYANDSDKPKTCGATLGLTNLIANLLYDVPTILQIHFTRLLQDSYDRKMRAEGTDMSLSIGGKSENANENDSLTAKLNPGGNVQV